MIEYDSIALLYICTTATVESTPSVCWRGNGGVVYLPALDRLSCTALQTSCSVPPW